MGQTWNPNVWSSGISKSREFYKLSGSSKCYRTCVCSYEKLVLLWLTGTDGETAFTISAPMEYFMVAHDGIFPKCKSEIKDFSFHGRNKNDGHRFLVQPDLRINLKWLIVCNSNTSEYIAVYSRPGNSISWHLYFIFHTFKRYSSMILVSSSLQSVAVAANSWSSVP